MILFILGIVFIRQYLFGLKGVIFDALVLLFIYSYVQRPVVDFRLELLPLYLWLSALTLYCSIWATTPNRTEYFKGIGLTFRTRKSSFIAYTFAWQLLVAFHEEIVWRVFFQSSLVENISAPLGILLVALPFTFWHRNNLRGSYSRTLEFLVFSLMLGLSYHLTHDLLLVVSIHFVRNVTIILATQHE